MANDFLHGTFALFVYTSLLAMSRHVLNFKFHALNTRGSPLYAFVPCLKQLISNRHTQLMQTSEIKINMFLRGDGDSEGRYITLKIYLWGTYIFPRKYD